LLQKWQKLPTVNEKQSREERTITLDLPIMVLCKPCTTKSIKLSSRGGGVSTKGKRACQVCGTPFIGEWCPVCVLRGALGNERVSQSQDETR
jgi:hypothetical protein